MTISSSHTDILDQYFVFHDVRVYVDRYAEVGKPETEIEGHPLFLPELKVRI